MDGWQAFSALFPRMREGEGIMTQNYSRRTDPLDAIRSIRGGGEERQVTRRRRKGESFARQAFRMEWRFMLMTDDPYTLG